MSNFQLGLIIAGALVLIAVVAHNAWTARRNAPKRAAPNPAGQEPPGAGVLAQERREPVFGALDDLPDVAVGGPAFDATVSLGEVPEPFAWHTHSTERHGALDALIDAIAPLALDQPVSGDAALAALPPTRRVGSKSFAIEGWNDMAQHWEPPQPGRRYLQFQAGVQLANRMGALNEIEFSEFVMKTQAFADAIGATPDFPDMLREVARARELDQFASEHDAQLTFVLRARQAAWSTGYLQQHATRLGLTPGAMPGRLVLPAAIGGVPPILTLSYDAQAAMSDAPEQSALRDVVLSLDVAQAPRQERAFERLREIATALCQTMDGVLCDQNGNPLPAMAMDPIATDLEQLYDQLEQHELPAGSMQARRLFS